MKLLSTFVIVLFLTGCSQMRPQVVQAPVDYWMKPGQARASSKAVSLLYYADYLRNLNQADYAQETEHVRLLANTERSDFRQLQYALALSMPGNETRKAQQIIDGLFKDNKSPDPELAALAQLLSADLAERRRLAADSRKAEVGAKRADDLEKKVEALKNIEKNLIQREQGPVEKQ